MKTFYTTAIAATLLAGAAHGADLPSFKSAPPAPPPAFSWSGFYVGFSSGYTWKGDNGVNTASANVFDTGLIPGQWAAASALGASGFSNARLNGFLSGAQAGYNWQFAESYMLGFEADIAGAGVRGGGGLLNATPSTVVSFGTAVTSSTVNRSLEYLGTARLRFGYAITPTTLVYATGGLAYGGVNLTTAVKQTLTPSLLASGGAKADFFDTRVGWAAGAGVEWAFAKNLSAKAEYLYYDLGSVGNALTAMSHDNIITGTPIVGVATALSTRYNGHILRVGLNYRFDGTGPDASDSGASTFAGPSLAAAAPPVFGDWRVSLMPYIWAINMNGSSTAKGETVGVDASFVDAITQSSAFPLAFMGRVEASNGPAFFYGDLAWMRVRFSGSALKLATPALDVNLAANAEARLKQTIAIGEAGAGYELARWRLGGAPGSFVAVDAYGGLRYWYVGIDLDLGVVGAVNSQLLGFQQIGARAIAKSGNMQWIDPVIGARVRYEIAPGEQFQFRGDIGGFGVGSKFSWQTYGGYSHDFKIGDFNLTSVIGYRALYVDYADGSGSNARGMNAILHGPVMGVSMPF